MRWVIAACTVLTVASCRGREDSARSQATPAAPSRAALRDARSPRNAAPRPDATTSWAPPPNAVKIVEPDGEPFWLDRTEVTVKQYRECVDAAACSAPVPTEDRPPDARPTPHEGVDETCRSSNITWDLPDHDDYPINCVTFMEAWRYCKFRGGRLPNYYEWELGAGAPHTDGFWYPWGRAEPTCKLAVMQDRRGPGCGHGGPWPVGSKPKGASPTGALDMAGNVSEIVIEHQKPSWEPVSDLFTSFGGSYADSGIDLDVDGGHGADGAAPTVGFRCVYFPPGRGRFY